MSIGLSSFPRHSPFISLMFPQSLQREGQAHGKVDENSSALNYKQWQAHLEIMNHQKHQLTKCGTTWEWSDSWIVTVCFGPQQIEADLTIHFPSWTLCSALCSRMKPIAEQDLFGLLFSCRLFTLMCFRAIRCGNETPMILLYILSLQDHQRDGEVNRQVTRWNTLKCGQTLPWLRILIFL